MYNKAISLERDLIKIPCVSGGKNDTVCDSKVYLSTEL